MDNSQILTLAGLAGLFIALSIGWSMVRARRQRLMTAGRVEPGAPPNPEKPDPADLQGDEDAQAPVFPVEMEPLPAAPLVAIETGDTKPATGPLSAAIAERDYKGFRISVREKQPGLWIAAVTGLHGRKRAATDISTREFYQMPAALAEAKAIIDHMGRALAPRR